MAKVEKQIESSDSKNVVKELDDLKGEIIGDGGDKERILATKGKLTTFMSSAPDPDSVEDWELKLYHFETVNRGPNAKPHPKMVVAEINTLKKDLMRQINQYLQVNPAKVLELQKLLNKWLYKGEKTPEGYYSYIDRKLLEKVLEGTGMELDYVPPVTTPGGNVIEGHYAIKEDGLLGPQTYAAIACIRDMYRD